MSDFIPPPPTGSDEEAVALKAIWDVIWGHRHLFVDTDVLKFTKDSQGRYTPVFKNPPLSRSGSGITFQGEWSDRSFSKDSIVIVSTGANAGTYISVQAIAAGGDPPSSGNNQWVQIAPSLFLNYWQ